MRGIFRIFMTMVAVFIMVGCAAVQPLPVAARAGDTITLALGSQEGMMRSNTTATFTPDATGVPVALSPKAIFNVYPDKRSNAYEANATYANSLVYGTSHEQWLTVMVVDLPQELPEGFGTIKVNTAAEQPVGPNAKVEDVDYRVEVLPGVGRPHGLQYLLSSLGTLSGNLNNLERIRGQVYVYPPVVSLCNGPQTSNYAAIEMRFQMPFVVEPYRDIEWIRVVADDYSVMTREKAPDLLWSASGNELKVVFMRADGKLRCYEPRFSIVPWEFGLFTEPPAFLSLTYYDIDGQVTTGPDMAAYQVVVR